MATTTGNPDSATGPAATATEPSSSSEDQVLPWDFYIGELRKVPGPMAELLETYSSIPKEEQKAHIVDVRDRAFANHPYPCLGRWRFLELDLSTHPLYQEEILGKLKKKTDNEGPEEEWIFLDLGTCLGQDVRKLIFDGADPSRIMGADLRPEFIDVGYALFRDEQTFPRAEHFVAPADVFDFSSSSELSKRCDGRVGILHACAIFHLFSLEQQRVVAKRCLQLLDPRGRGGRVLICGAQVGNVNAGEYPTRRRDGSRFRHNGDSWRKMWEEVVAEDEWKGKIRGLEVGCVMLGREVVEDRTDQTTSSAEDEMNNKGKFMGLIEKGFRWMKYWVWIEFA